MDGRERRYRGPLLRDLVAAAKPVERHRFDLRQSVVVLHASDGYAAVYSWAELFLTPIGEDSVVACDRDGTPLGDDEGPIAAVSGRDQRSGPRHVRWLESIGLLRAPDTRREHEEEHP